jgi:pimeloyl-ACP methyl ester carboxylesterase
MSDVWTTEGSVRLFAVESGEGPALVFLHGGLTDHRAVLPVVQPLSDRYRVVTPDLRGSGRSWCSASLTFERLSDDLLGLLDHLGVEAAFVGGISSGSGPAVHFALRYPERTLGLIVVHPVYGGSERGYTRGQTAAFAGMNAVASRAAAEGVEVLRAMYFSQLPEAMAQRAWGMASGFDPGSVTATSGFIASGAQPFKSSQDLQGIGVPALLVRGGDPVHPAEISDVYAESLQDLTVVPLSGVDTTPAIRDFMDDVIAS